MELWEDFRFVFGYLPEIDRLPTMAEKCGLRCRVAAVLNYSDVPHSPLYWDMVGAFVENLDHDSIVFEIDTESTPLVFTSVREMQDLVESRPTDYGGPFDRATLYLRGKAKAFIDTEAYAMCGGPQPYSDSWTFAIYRETDEATGLNDACYGVCSQYGLPTLEAMHGLPDPQEPPFSKRLLRWLFPEWVR